MTTQHTASPDTNSNVITYGFLRLDTLKSQTLRTLVGKYTTIPNTAKNKTMVKWTFYDYLAANPGAAAAAYMDPELAPYIAVYGADGVKTGHVAATRDSTITFLNPPRKATSLTEQLSTFEGSAPATEPTPPAPPTYTPVPPITVPSAPDIPASAQPFSPLVSLTSDEFEARLQSHLTSTLRALGPDRSTAMTLVRLDVAETNIQSLHANTARIHTQSWQAHRMAETALTGLSTVTDAFNTRFAEVHRHRQVDLGRVTALESRQEKFQRDTERQLREKKLVVFDWSGMENGQFTTSPYQDAMALFERLQVRVADSEFDVQRVTTSMNGRPAGGILRLELGKIDLRNRLLKAYENHAREMMRLYQTRPAFRVAKDKSPGMMDIDKDTQARVDYLRWKSVETHGHELDYRRRDNGLVTLWDAHGRSTLVSRAILDAIPEEEVLRFKRERQAQTARGGFIFGSAPLQPTPAPEEGRRPPAAPEATARPTAAAPRATLPTTTPPSTDYSQRILRGYPRPPSPELVVTPQISPYPDSTPSPSQLPVDSPAFPRRSRQATVEDEDASPTAPHSGKDAAKKDEQPRDVTSREEDGGTNTVTKEPWNTVLGDVDMSEHSSDSSYRPSTQNGDRMDEDSLFSDDDSDEEEEHDMEEDEEQLAALAKQLHGSHTNTPSPSTNYTAFAPVHLPSPNTATTTAYTPYEKAHLLSAPANTTPRA